MKCSQCGFDIPAQSNFCPQCGAIVSPAGIAHVEERRKVTVFFSDVSGYTAMSERLDTEDVKDLMGRIFSRAGDIVARLDGHISKYIGDCVMVLFGYPTAHEDDAVRAIQAAMELHAYVESLNTAELVGRIGRRISMHTGMNTGPIVAGTIDMDKGHEDVLGDTINVASRFDGIAGAGEILVGLATQQEAARCFDFQEIGQQSVKGKSDPLRAFRVRGRRSMRQSVCLDGASAPLIGRKREMALLHEALAGLKQGTGAAFSICGVPGSGKTRLVEELAKSVEVEQMRYLDAVCHEYSRNIPYSLWTNLLARQWNITESESPESTRQKIEAGVRKLLPDDSVRYVSAMFALPDPETRNMDAGFLKAEIHGSVVRFVKALIEKERSVLCFEDMHWADPSSIELLGALLAGKTEPALFLFVSRPPFLPDFLANKTISIPHQVVMLDDLSSEEEEQMVGSLLRTTSVPPGLTEYVRNRIKGNPLFIQEVVNNLIEQKLLVREQSWKLVRGLSGADIPGTVQNVIAARLDRLSPSTKRLVQTMAVIGPTFTRSLVERLSEQGTGLDTDLRQLLDMEIIQEQSYGDGIEYAFKHALLREAAYESLLKTDRRQLHALIAGVLENASSGTLSEKYGAIAHHYSLSGNVDKAVEYLVLAADQYLARYAAEEANINYQEAYDLLISKGGGSTDDHERLIGLINKWGWVFYFYGNFKKSVEVHEKHLKEAEAVDDAETKGMFFNWYSWALFFMMRFQEAIRFACTALEVGERMQNQKVIAYANIFLLHYHSQYGKIREGHPYAVAAEVAVAHVHDDPYLYFKYLNVSGFHCILQGHIYKAVEYFKKQIEFGERHRVSRALSVGYSAMGYALSSQGDFEEARKCFENAFAYTKDPFYWSNCISFYALFLFLTGDIQNAEGYIEKVIDHCRDNDLNSFLTFEALMGLVEFSKGNLASGYSKAMAAQKMYLRSGSYYFLALAESINGKIHLQVLLSKKPVPFSTFIRNFFWIVGHVPSAFHRARNSFTKVIEITERHGMQGMLAEAWRDLGTLYMARRKRVPAEKCFTTAFKIYEALGSQKLCEDIRRQLEAARA